MVASDAISSATSSATWRSVAPSSEKLKSTIHGWHTRSTTMLAARSDRCAIPAPCNLLTCFHSVPITMSVMP
jgi:hypothetical protein